MLFVLIITVIILVCSFPSLFFFLDLQFQNPENTKNEKYFPKFDADSLDGKTWIDVELRLVFIIPFSVNILYVSLHKHGVAPELT